MFKNQNFRCLPFGLGRCAVATLALACIAPITAIAQVCATPGRDSTIPTIAGVINTYHAGGTGSVPIGAVSIPVGVAQPGGSAAIAPGDLLIVIQMQGAQINSSNSDCYGDGVGAAGCATRATTTASYAGGNTAANYLAGNWEYCTATSTAGATVGVACGGVGGGTVNAYQSAPSTGISSNGAYSYQVVRVPQYANVSLTADVTPLAWNGTVGGVLGLQATGAVTMAGFNLNASARGFRGGGQTFIAPYGPPVIDPVNGSSFYTAATGVISGTGPGGEREGSFKGEGIAGTPRLVYNGTAQVDTLVDGITGGSRGRGAPGNAGGGGNNQNSGGGGGGNGGLGGNGGGGWNDASRPVTFVDSGGFGGDGASRAGNNLLLSPTRLIMGGGGGAGHVDGGGTACEQGGWGGNGAGIVVVRAASLAGTGSLLANGGNGFLPNIPGSCTDAGGGAGAGGSVLAAVGTGLAGRVINVNGGAGANSYYSQHGPGGGGGGGVSYYNSTGGAPAATASGGINGLDRGNAPPAAPAPWFATAGSVSTLNTSVTTFTNLCSTALGVTKTNNTTTAQAGGTTSYTVTFTNTGVTAANGSVVKDIPSAGLVCTVAACTASTTPIAASCPAPAQWPNLLTPAGVALPGFPAQSTVTFVVNCNITATGT